MPRLVRLAWLSKCIFIDNTRHCTISLGFIKTILYKCPNLLSEMRDETALFPRRLDDFARIRMDLSAGQSGLMTGRRLEKAWSLGRGIEVPGCMVLIMLYMNMIEYDCSRIIYLEGFSPTSHSSFYCFCVGCENNPKLTPIATSHNRKSRHLRVDVSGLRSKGAKSR